jgi:hypothetical protein
MRASRAGGRRGASGGRIHPAAAAGRMPAAPPTAPPQADAQMSVPGTPSDLPGGSEGLGQMADMRATLMQGT